MSTTQWTGFVLFWAVWLLAPLLVDGVNALVSLIGVWSARSWQTPAGSLTYHPRVSVIVPVYNSERTLGACLESLAAQDYPREQIEILVISNGTTDRSFDVFDAHQSRYPGHLWWQAITNKGKSWALNAGIHLATGVYIFPIDSDVVLAPDALRKIVERFEAEPNLGAVTGSIEVLPPVAGSTVLQTTLAECEFQEYLTAFQIGRQYQTLTKNLFTLAGAFSAFRRNVLLGTFGYNQQTVTEDTDLTFEIHQRFPQYRIGGVAAAIAYVHPIESVSALYAQRVRWQRGQLEVSARYEKLMARKWWIPSGFTPSRVLLIDHTLAFPRLAWTFLMPVLVLFDYPGSLLVGAAVVLYLLYMLIDLSWLLTSWALAGAEARRRLRNAWWIFAIMPLYRIVVFWFRLSGFLHAVAEPGAWRVQDPVAQTRAALADLVTRVRRLLQSSSRSMSPKG